MHCNSRQSAGQFQRPASEATLRSLQLPLDNSDRFQHVQLLRRGSERMGGDVNLLELVAEPGELLHRLGVGEKGAGGRSLLVVKRRPIGTGPVEAFTV